MTSQDYIKPFNEALERKRNSFSRNLLLSYKDEFTDPDWYQQRMLSKVARWVSDEDVSEELAYFLFVYEMLNIHAIDEKESPIPFNVLESIYGDNVFVLQRLKIKNSVMLLIEDVGTMSAGFAGAKRSAIVNVFRSTWNFTVRELGDINLPRNRNSYLDFGYLKSAMTLRKTYGIQDLLEVGFQIFNAYKQKKTQNYDIGDEFKELIIGCRIIFNLESPSLSTITLLSPNVLTLQGKTKIISENDFISKIKSAITIFNACNLFNSLNK